MSRVSAASAGRNVSRRILKELETWNSVESKDEKGVERLGPTQDEELFKWEAVINGRGKGQGERENKKKRQTIISAPDPPTVNHSLPFEEFLVLSRTEPLDALFAFGLDGVPGFEFL